MVMNVVSHPFQDDKVCSRKQGFAFDWSYGCLKPLRLGNVSTLETSHQKCYRTEQCLSGQDAG